MLGSSEGCTDVSDGPEVNAQENWLSGIHELIQGMLCGLDKKLPFFNDEQLV